MRGTAMGSLPIWSANHGAVALPIPSVELGRMVQSWHPRNALLKIKIMAIYYWSGHSGDFCPQQEKQGQILKVSEKSGARWQTAFYKDDLVYSPLTLGASPLYGWARVPSKQGISPSAACHVFKEYLIHRKQSPHALICNGFPKGKTEKQFAIIAIIAMFFDGAGGRFDCNYLIC